MAHEPGHTEERGSGFLSRIGGFLGGLPLGAIAQTGLSAAYLDDQLQRLQDIGQLGYEGAQDVTDLALKTGKFKPFTVTTGFGDVDTTKKVVLKLLLVQTSKLDGTLFQE